MDKFENYIPKCNTSNLITSHNIIVKRQKQLEKAFERTTIEFENYKKNVRYNRNIFYRIWHKIKRVLRL